jgi:uncharacterized membrane protein
MSLLAWLLGLEDPGSVTAIGGWLLRPGSPLHWAWIAALALVATAAAGLNLLPQTLAPKRTRALLVGLRLVGFALLAAMLLQLEAEVTVSRSVPPTVAVLTDTSASMHLRDAGAGASRLEAAERMASGPLAEVLARARVVPYRFGWQLAGTEGDRAAAGEGAGGGTRLMQAIEEVARREGDLRAMVVLSDGNDTAGDRGQLVAPVLAARRLPAYPVVFGGGGGTALPRLRSEGGGAYVRLGDELRLAATLSAGGAAEQTVAVRVYESGKQAPVASRENVRLGGEPSEVSFLLKPDSAGRKSYRIVAEGVRSELAGEDASLLSVDREVDVLDEKINVLYVDIPRDERKLLGHWLARDPVVDLATLTLMPKGGWHAQGGVLHKNVGEGLPGDEAELSRYDVVILGDIPRAYFREGGDVSETKLQRLVDFVARRGGGLITLGGRSVYGAGRYQDSALARILPFAIDVQQQEQQIRDAFTLAPTPAGLAHPIMQLDADPQENRNAWLDLPRLDGANLVGAVRPGASLLAAFEGEGDAIVPMMAVHHVGKGQVLSLAFDTTWRWEMQRAAESVDHYRRFWGNALRALAPDPRVAPKRPQIVKHRSRPPLGQRLTLSTRLVDDTYRPISGADLRVTVTSPSQRITAIYPSDGRQAPGLYEYDVLLDEPGAWQVAATFGGTTVTERIVAGEDQRELDDPRPRPEEMRAFAAATGGRSFSAVDATGLAAALDLTPQLVRRPAAIALWNLPSTLLLVLAVICLDCWVRKRRGMA